MQNSRTKSEAGILVLVVFVLGLLVGGVGNHLWGARVWGSARQNHAGPGHPPPPGTFTQRLGLTPDQQKQWDAIFTDSHLQFQAIDSQRDALRLQVRAKFRAVLTPDQQVKFDAIVKEQDARGRGGPNHGGPPPGGDRGPGAGPHPGPGF